MRLCTSKYNNVIVYTVKCIGILQAIISQIYDYVYEIELEINVIYLISCRFMIKKKNTSLSVPFHSLINSGNPAVDPSWWTVNRQWTTTNITGTHIKYIL